MPPPRGTPNPIEGPGDYDVTTVVHNDTYPSISPLSIPPLNKKVFITGASKGLGLSVAISFARAGASHIAIGARPNLSSAKSAILSAASAAHRPVPKVLCVELDITSESSVSAAATLVETEFGGLDVVINNAGILEGVALVADSDPDTWWRNWEVNLKGPYLVIRAFLPLLLKGGDKTIITTSSVGALRINPGLSAYQPSKLAVLRFMEFVAKEYADKGVLAFCIHPGNVVTDIVGGKDGLQEELRPVFVETPELSSNTLVFLVKEKRDWLSGRYVNCTWDMPELMEKEKEIVKGDKLKVKFDF